MSMQPFVPPEQFGEYRVLQRLGEGTTGHVFLCLDVALQRRVAVKFFKGAHIDPALMERFWIEARAVARLAHPNIVSIYGVGEHAGTPYLVSELVDGQRLDALSRPQSWASVLAIGRQLAQGLSAAHRAQILHRDIKPQNIMYTAQGEVKLLDFGLAKVLDVPTKSAATSTEPAGAPLRSARLPQGPLDETPPYQAAPQEQVPTTQILVSPPRQPAGVQLTDATSLLGTPLYVAPEIFAGQAASPRSDVYSLGVVLFELLCGHPPHEAPDIGALRERVLHKQAPSLHTLAPQVPPRFAAIVDRCLRHRPEDRYADAAALLSELDQLASTPSLPSLPSLPSAGPSARQRFARYAAICALIVGLLLLLRSSLLQYATALRQGSPPRGMVRLEGGRFTMGSAAHEIESAQLWCQRLRGPECDREVLAQFDREQPTRSVEVRAFWLDRTEVTNQAFSDWLNRQHNLTLEQERYVYAGKSSGQKGVLFADLYPFYQPANGLVYNQKAQRFQVPRGHEWQPVTQITWLAANAYCLAQGGRLPTEAEWEYAARGSEGRRFPWGFEEPHCGEVAIAADGQMSCPRRLQGPVDVGSSRQDVTPEGIYDLAGNVPEWVQDTFSERYPSCGPPCTSPLLQETSSARLLRVLRGGGWNWSLYTARATTRSRWWQDEAVTNFGFRCAADQR